jgi:hypothetical protein
MEALRQVPPINDILKSAELSTFRSVLGYPYVARMLEDILSAAREEIVRSGSAISRAELTSRIASELARRLGPGDRESC